MILVFTALSGQDIANAQIYQSHCRSHSQLWVCMKTNPRRIVVSYERKYVHEVLVNCLFKLAQEIVWLVELILAMTIAVDLGRKATQQTNKQIVNRPTKMGSEP